MKEIGILYSTEMVRAKLDDRKSMTRRTRGLEEINENTDDWEFIRMEGRFGIFYNKINGSLIVFKCPYGQPGDLHYVRETHYRYGHWIEDEGEFSKTSKQKWKFVALTDEVLFEDNRPSSVLSTKIWQRTKDGWYKRPSLYLPKSAARIWDQVVSVRAERLQDISEAEAICEGVQRGVFREGPNTMKGDFHLETMCKGAPIGDYKDGFRFIISQINGREVWEKNKWVWVIGTNNILKTGRPA